jgi:hypothetical protein
VAASTSVAGLALLTKCINNTGGIPVEVWLCAVVALGILASQMIGEIKTIKKWKSFDLYGLVKVTACSLALIGLVIVGTHAADLGKNANQFSLNHGNFVSFTKEIEEYVPPNTLAVGEGTTAIYMELGWDKQHYKFYSTDDELRELFSTNDSFFIFTGVTVPWEGGTELTDNSQFVDLGKYYLSKSFTYNGLHYGYYQRNPT